MKAVLLAVALSCLALPALAAETSPWWATPPSSETQVQQAQYWIYNYTNAQYAQLSSAQRAIIWAGMVDAPSGGNTSIPLFPPGTIVGAYEAVSRLPDHVGNTGVGGIGVHACGATQDCTYTYLDTNFPSWIMRQSDHATPAWLAGDTTWVPVDITNAAVITQIKAYTQQLLDAGAQAISVDNIGDRNAFDQEGVCSVAIPDYATGGTCATHGGTWTQIYTAPGGLTNQVDSGVFTTAQESLLSTLKTFAHQRNAMLIGNIAYDYRALSTKTVSDPLTSTLVNDVDTWLQEGASFTSDNNPPPCLPGGSNSTLTINGTVTAGAVSIPTTTVPGGGWVTGSLLSIPGAGPNGTTWVGRQNGAVVGSTVPITPATSTTVVGGVFYIGGPSYGTVDTSAGSGNFSALYTFITGATPTNSGNGSMIQGNSICPLGTPSAVARPALDWAVGAYLISMPGTNAQTYIQTDWSGPLNGAGGFIGDASYDDDQGGAYPELTWVHGTPTDNPAIVTAGVYHRRFANGIVVCNPLTSAVNFTFPAGQTYYDFTNAAWTGTMSITGPSCVLGHF